MPSKKFTAQIGVLGPAAQSEYPRGGGATARMLSLAYEVGSQLAQNGVVVVTGGKSGVMEAAAQGAFENGGVTIGVVKGPARGTSNIFTDIEYISGMASDGLDELLLVNMCDAVIVIGGGAGTLEEVSIAYRNGKPIVSLLAGRGWGDALANKYLDERKKVKVISAQSARAAVKKILSLVHKTTSS